MRFHATTKTAEGQCYAALQQGVPQQPVVPLLFYLPPHKADSCKAMCEAESPLRGTPWHSLLAPPLCRCQEGGGGCKVLFVSMHQMLDVFHCNNKSHVLCVVFKVEVCLSTPLCVSRGRVPAIQ